MGIIYSMVQGYLTAKADTSPNSMPSIVTNSILSNKTSNGGGDKGEESIEHETKECRCQRRVSVLPMGVLRAICPC